MDCHLRINEYSDITKLAKILYSWLGENYRMLYQKEVSLPWLSLPQLGQNIVKAEDSSTLDPQRNDNKINASELSEQECTNCKKDLIDILIYFLSEGIDYCTQNQIKGNRIYLATLRELILIYTDCLSKYSVVKIYFLYF